MRSDQPGRSLFASAALFNWLVGVILLLAPAAWRVQMGLPAPPWDSALAQMGVGAVILFGWAYWMVSRDAQRYRPYVVLGIIGKTLTVVVLFANWWVGNIPLMTAALSTIDAIYVVLFARFLIGTRSESEADRVARSAA